MIVNKMFANASEALINKTINTSDDSVAEQMSQTMQEQQDKYNLWYDKDSPLNEAQIISNNYMLQKQRKPMVIEYYKHKPVPGEDPSEYMESIEMYINPNKIIVSQNKVKGKTYTRGGIFYHHWGDDNPTMSISGVVGYSGMKGIEQLEKIYNYSGSLLRYQNLGITKIGENLNQKYTVIDANTPLDILKNLGESYTTIDNLKESIEQVSTTTNYAEATKLQTNILIDNMNMLTNDNTIESKIASILSDAKNLASQIVDLYEITTPDMFLKYITDEYYKDQGAITRSKLEGISLDGTYNIESLMKDLAYVVMIEYKDKIQFEGYPKFYNEMIRRSILNYNDFVDAQGKSYLLTATNEDVSQKKEEQVAYYLYDIQKMNKQSTIDRDDIVSGIADIRSELEDEWRPRQVFIYFEDRVYIGHFDNFTYNRQAETPVISYDMKFTIIRQIISYVNYMKPIAEVEELDMGSLNGPEQSAVINTIENLKKEILRCKEVWTHRHQMYSDVDGWTSQEFAQWKEDCKAYTLQQVQKLQKIEPKFSATEDMLYKVDFTNDDTTYSSMALTPDKRIFFYTMAEYKPYDLSRYFEQAELRWKAEIDRAERVFVKEFRDKLHTDSTINLTNIEMNGGKYAYIVDANFLDTLTPEQYTRAKQIIDWTQEIRVGAKQYVSDPNYNSWEVNLHAQMTIKYFKQNRDNPQTILEAQNEMIRCKEVYTRGLAYNRYAALDRDFTEERKLSIVNWAKEVQMAMNDDLEWYNDVDHRLLGPEYKVAPREYFNDGNNWNMELTNDERIRFYNTVSCPESLDCAFDEIDRIYMVYAALKNGPLPESGLTVEEHLKNLYNWLRKIGDECKFREPIRAYILKNPFLNEIEAALGITGENTYKNGSIYQDMTESVKGIELEDYSNKDKNSIFRAKIKILRLKNELTALMDQLIDSKYNYDVNILVNKSTLRYYDENNRNDDSMVKAIYDDIYNTNNNDDDNPNNKNENENYINIWQRIYNYRKAIRQILFVTQKTTLSWYHGGYSFPTFDENKNYIDKYAASGLDYEYYIRDKSGYADPIYDMYCYKKLTTSNNFISDNFLDYIEFSTEFKDVSIQTKILKIRDILKDENLLLNAQQKLEFYSMFTNNADNNDIKYSIQRELDRCEFIYYWRCNRIKNLSKDEYPFIGTNYEENRENMKKYVQEYVQNYDFTKGNDEYKKNVNHLYSIYCWALNIKSQCRILNNNVMQNIKQYDKHAIHDWQNDLYQILKGAKIIYEVAGVDKFIDLSKINYNIEILNMYSQPFCGIRDLSSYNTNSLIEREILRCKEVFTTELLIAKEFGTLLSENSQNDRFAWLLGLYITAGNTYPDNKKLGLCNWWDQYITTVDEAQVLLDKVINRDYDYLSYHGWYNFINEKYPDYYIDQRLYSGLILNGEDRMDYYMGPDYPYKTGDNIYLETFDDGGSVNGNEMNVMIDSAVRARRELDRAYRVFEKYYQMYGNLNNLEGYMSEQKQKLYDIYSWYIGIKSNSRWLNCKYKYYPELTFNTYIDGRYISNTITQNYHIYTYSPNALEIPDYLMARVLNRDADLDIQNKAWRLYINDDFGYTLDSNGYKIYNDANKNELIDYYSRLYEFYLCQENGYKRHNIDAAKMEILRIKCLYNILYRRYLMEQYKDGRSLELRCDKEIYRKNYEDYNLDYIIGYNSLKQLHIEWMLDILMHLSWFENDNNWFNSHDPNCMYYYIDSGIKESHDSMNIKRKDRLIYYANCNGVGRLNGEVQQFSIDSCYETYCQYDYKWMNYTRSAETARIDLETCKKQYYLFCEQSIYAKYDSAEVLEVKQDLYEWAMDIRTTCKYNPHVFSNDLDWLKELAGVLGRNFDTDSSNWIIVNN